MEDHATSISSPYAGLPLEIWSGVIRNLDTDDIPHAWFSLRRVSRAMRDATEHAFRTHFLRQATIKFPLGSGPVLSEAERRVVAFVKVDVSMALSHFSGDGDDGDGGGDDHARAHFAHRPDPEQEAHDWEASGLAAWQRRNWNRTVDGYKVPYGGDGQQSGWYSHDVRPHLFILRWLVNDAGFPGMQLDGEARTLSFLWKPFLDGFCGEILRVRELEREYARQNGGSERGGSPTGEAVFRVWYGDPSFQPPAGADLNVPEDFTWEHLVRRERGERWDRQHASDDRHPEGKEEFPWLAHSRKIQTMEQLRQQLHEELRPRKDAVVAPHEDPVAA